MSGLGFGAWCLALKHNVIFGGVRESRVWLLVLRHLVLFGGGHDIQILDESLFLPSEAKNHKHASNAPFHCAGPQDNAHPIIAGIRALGPIQEPIMTNTPLSKLSGVPFIGGVFLPWSPVHAVGKAAAAGATLVSFGSSKPRNIFPPFAVHGMRDWPW